MECIVNIFVCVRCTFKKVIISLLILNSSESSPLLFSIMMIDTYVHQYFIDKYLNEVVSMYRLLPLRFIM